MADAQPLVGEALVHTAPESWATFFAEAFQASTFKSYWGMLHYLTSRWAFTCFAMALLLNRIGVYGASRQRIQLTWTRRLALRIVPILLLTSQAHSILQAIRCQTSPNFSLYRHGDNNKYSLLDWSSDGGSLHILTSTLLFRSTDAEACAAVGLSRPEPDVKAPFGSFSLLWPAFLRLSLAHAVESLSCTLQQIPSMTEVGMSVFEHSLAFAEAETMISHTLGLGLFGNGKPASVSETTPANSSSSSGFQATIPASGTILAIADATTSLTSPHFLDRVNVPVEVLLVTLLSCSNALSSHVIAVLGKQRQWRLINTGIWGMAFMGSFVWGLMTTSVMVRGGDDGDDRPVSSLLHFPTVAIVGFLPHMCIILGICVCLVIYLVALVLTAVSLGTNPYIPQPTSFKQRFSIAHDNLQAAVQTRGINIRWYEDFYTALLRVGFAALTAASEAVFLNEGRSVEVRQFTWLEEDRLDEFETAKNEQGALSNTQQFQILEEYGLPPSSPGGTDKGGVWESGFAKERKFEQKEGELSGKDSFVYPTPRTGGVGAVQRTTRFYLLMIYLRGILFLIGGYIAYGLGMLLDSIGITSRPRWLRKLVGRSLKKTRKEKRRTTSGIPSDNWFFSADGKFFTSGEIDVDIEPDMRRQLMTEFPGERVDELLDKKLYDWWKGGGLFGTKDESDDYIPPTSDDNDDTTSVISVSTAMSESHHSEDDAWESEPDGQRTPTQSAHSPSWSFSGLQTRESTPDLIDSPLDPATLARLLNPQDKESRDQARVLASHLSSSQPSGMMTRSRYRREQERERAKILLAGRLPHPSVSSSPNISLYSSTKQAGPRPLTTTEEAEVLESLILNRRRKHAPPPRPNPASGDVGADDEASRQAGPPCVVCQTAARTIIAWPCRCLCVCEDCRVSLALNNFGNCVTCRRSVQGFVRLYVP
ncbi:uncharacterized protein A1O9_08420 [Exophiala aquamarina CBS 119918]|uniref:RING-type domain-containing protein n=1 Tax=Exophiala aquamarina CBS 119918 TaxID=1182545 RepID=A0A072PJH3_9EURO|nr:uncharacterized protein A1O9_08420 [Exophiala aquamarina CBS 119918]KEF55670.1 hypothetical protein A1O9_08420 [Exophiala aquamarina CBS 119918]